jgi:hypothetical protein
LSDRISIKQFTLYLPLSNFPGMIDSKNGIIIKTTAEFLSTRLSSSNAF